MRGKIAVCAAATAALLAATPLSAAHAHDGAGLAILGAAALGTALILSAPPVPPPAVVVQPQPVYVAPPAAYYAPPPAYYAPPPVYYAPPPTPVYYAPAYYPYYRSYYRWR